LEHVQVEHLKLPRTDLALNPLQRVVLFHNKREVSQFDEEALLISTLYTGSLTERPTEPQRVYPFENPRSAVKYLAASLDVLKRLACIRQSL
jgi:hypothetical protein